MTKESQSLLLRSLAEFRHQLRLFTLFSETAAQAAGIQPQQHQLLLQIAGCDPDIQPTIAYAAERLGLCHNSTVELVNRCVKEDLLVRAPDPEDRRRVLLQLTVKGRRVLSMLSEQHARELEEMAPRLIQSFKRVRKVGRS